MGHSKRESQGWNKGFEKGSVWPTLTGFCFTLGRGESEHVWTAKLRLKEPATPLHKDSPRLSLSSALKGAVGSTEMEINHGFVYYPFLFASLRAEISSMAHKCQD